MKYIVPIFTIISFLVLSVSSVFSIAWSLPLIVPIVLILLSGTTFLFMAHDWITLWSPLFKKD